MAIEQLLNKLIEKGWKPFDRNYQRYEHGCLIREFTTEDGVYSYGQYPKTYRELVSKESGLWQFVCENGMINANDTPEENVVNYWRYNKKDLTEWWYMRNYQYRLIESALCDEDKLEDFLLSNIKVEGQ